MKRDMLITRLEEVLSKAKTFGDLPILMHDGENFHRIGRVSILELPEIEESRCLILRTGGLSVLSDLSQRILYGMD